MNPSIADGDSVRASNPVPQSDIFYDIDGSFQLHIGSYSVGAASEEAIPGWYLFIILDSGSSVANFTLENGILRQDGKVVQRYYHEDLSLRPKRLYVTELTDEYTQPTRWLVHSDDNKRTLGFGEGGE